MLESGKNRTGIHIFHLAPVMPFSPPPTDLAGFVRIFESMLRFLSRFLLHLFCIFNRANFVKLI